MSATLAVTGNPHKWYKNCGKWVYTGWGGIKIRVALVAYSVPSPKYFENGRNGILLDLNSRLAYGIAT
eukprot:3860947-Rhodomonas_salina.2